MVASRSLGPLPNPQEKFWLGEVGSSNPNPTWDRTADPNRSSSQHRQTEVCGGGGGLTFAAQEWFVILISSENPQILVAARFRLLKDDQ